MNERIEERPEYAWLREFKKLRGWELIDRHGAHGLGIGWKRVDGEKTDQPALVFYVTHKSGDSGEIPATFSFTPSGSAEAVELVTDVVQTPAATFESKPTDDAEGE